MKLYDENKNYVADIPKPEPIEQDGKWWEFPKIGIPKRGHKYYHTGGGLRECFDGWGNFAWNIRWIASEIPRATPEQLRAIGMRERDGRPVECKEGDKVWNGGSSELTICDNEKECPCREISGKYRFVLVPDVQEEKHIQCRDCASEIDGQMICKDCIDWSKNSYGQERKHYTPKQPQPEEPMFTNEQMQQIDQWIESIINDHPNNTEFIAHLHYLKGLLYNLSFGILAFTEGRRG